MEALRMEASGTLTSRPYSIRNQQLNQCLEEEINTRHLAERIAESWLAMTGMLMGPHA